MRWGIVGKVNPDALKYADAINAECIEQDFPPMFAYAIAWRESIGGEVHGAWPNAASVIAADGGRGLFQLTSWYPDDWHDPSVNCHYAVKDWLLPDCLWIWRTFGAYGEDLVRFAAASFNAGRGGAERGHLEGDVDKYTTDRYGENVLRIYKLLVSSGKVE